jgi:hypothetical protein
MSIIGEELKHLRTEPRDLRKFGLMVGGVFALLGLWFLFRHKPWHAWFWIPGALLIAAGAIAPRGLKHIYVAWMSMAFVLGFIMSTLLLTAFFYLVVTPVGLLAKVAGKDFLQRKWSSSPSYWILRPPGPMKEPNRYEQQF